MIKGLSRSSKKKRANAKKIKKEPTKSRLANVEVITDKKWTKVKGFNKEEVDIYLQTKRCNRVAYEGALRKFFYWNFVNNDNKACKYISYLNGLDYAEFLRDKGYKESTIQTHFNIISGFGLHLKKRYKANMLNISLANDCLGKRLDVILTEEEYEKLLNIYIDNENWFHASMLSYLYTKKVWYTNFTNIPMRIYESLIWNEESERYVQEEAFGLSLTEECYKVMELMISSRVAKGNFVFLNSRGVGFNNDNTYRLIISILSDYLEMKTNKKYKVTTMEDFKYYYLKDIQRKEAVKKQKRDYYHKSKDKRETYHNRLMGVENSNMGRETFKKKIVTDDLLKQISRQNVKLGERFLREKGTRCSELTIKNYRSDLNIFWCWNFMYNDDTFFIDIKKFELADFFAYAVKDLKWGGSRFARMKSTLSSLSEFVERFFDKEFPDFRNIVLKAIENMPRSERRTKTVLSNEQVEQIFKYYEDKDEPQKACLFALACYSGSRKSELLRFTTENLDVDNTAFEGIFIETKTKIKTKGRGAEGKMLHKYIIRDKFLPHYEKWIKIRNEIVNKKELDHDFIFIDELTGQPIVSPGSIGRWLEDLESVIGVHVYTHSLRHYMATSLCRLGIEDSLIIELFGWTSADMLNLAC